MRVLFVGEGPHDIGETAHGANRPRPAQGVIPTLSRKVCPNIAADSLAIAFKEIVRFNPRARKKGFEAKVPAAVLVASKFGCSGTVVVADRDGELKRLEALAHGASAAMGLFPDHPIAYGVAVESIEAWTLAMQEAIADVLGLDVEKVRAQYPGVHVEMLKEQSGKQERRPKRLLAAITGLTHRADTTEFRQEVADRTDVTELQKACPGGFAKFAEQLQRAFGTANSGG